MSPRLLVATKNRGKAREISALLESLVEVETLLDRPSFPEVVETGETFLANARLKAEHVAAALSVPVLADDSGLVVDALNGAPGVRSARYAPGSDADRVEKLLRALSGVPMDLRTARFTSVVAFAVPGRPTIISEGRVEGKIALSPRGEGGFGYDPVFLVEGGPRTMAELSEGEKNLCSHRARALAKMRSALASHFSLVLGAPNP